ncbi:MAG: 2-dehydropantoate 2-reductase [Deltaproteobacteria bacterium]|nr:2-dehydropantoate 2-reductase [Deltaproteobacteria bacterium]
MRYLIAGTGALGSVFAGLLQHSGHEVACLGRGEHFEQASRQGLEIDGIWGNFRIGPLTAAPLEPENDAPYEVILLCVKSFDTQEACRQLRGRLAPQGLIVSVQNGLGNLEIIAREFGESRTIGARVIFGAHIKQPGVVTVTVYAAPVLLGAMDRKLSGEKLSRVAADLNRAGIPTEVVAEIIPHLWDKVLYNCALNPLGAILGAPYGALGDDPQTRELMRLIIKEIYEVASAKGITLHYPEAAVYFRHFLEDLVPPTAAHWPSMWQDLQAGRRTEIEALNGAICRYGREMRVATPYNETMSRLIRFLENRLTRLADSH